MSGAPRMIEHDTQRDEISDAMLALAEHAVRVCLDQGMEPQIAARLERLLGRPVSPPARAEVSLDFLALSRVLCALKVARSSRLTPNEQSANMLARADVLRVMRSLSVEVD